MVEEQLMKGHPLHGGRAQRSDDVRSPRQVASGR